ncbi:hypothetical protein Tco_0974408 [Tanacetum coccineum]|uniref:Uncharacterized protein n=1 Tax=Tanacetum coccineum TaxID=301880 RepID=A0ABQ5EBM8_9ASTR
MSTLRISSPSVTVIVAVYSYTFDSRNEDSLQKVKGNFQDSDSKINAKRFESPVPEATVTCVICIVEVLIVQLTSRSANYGWHEWKESPTALSASNSSGLSGVGSPLSLSTRVPG